MRRISQIKENQRTKISPAAVGVPPTDDSAQIIVKGATDLFGAMHERQVKVDELSAMSKYGDWGMQYAFGKAELQEKYRNSPAEYPKAAKELGDKLVRDFGNSLGIGAANKFREITTRAMAQDVDNNTNWAVQQDQKIIIGDINKGFADLALAGEFVTGPEELKALLGENSGKEGDFSLATYARNAEAFLSADTVAQIKEQHRKQIVENALNAALLNDPQKTYTNLASRKYEGVISKDEEITFLNRSKNAMIEHGILQQTKVLATASAEISDLITQVNEGKVTTADISRTLSWAEANKSKKDVNNQPIVSLNYIEGLKAVRDWSLGLDTRTTAQKTDDETAFANKFEAKWDVFLSMRKKGQKSSAKDYDEVLGLYASLVRANQSGLVSNDRFEKLKGVLDTKLKSSLGGGGKVASLNEALEKAGTRKWFNWGNPDDVYSHGYEQILTEVQGRADLDAAGKRALKEDLIISYMDVVNNMPEETVSSQKNKAKFAYQILHGGDLGMVRSLAVYKDAATGKSYRYGERVTTRAGVGRVVGIDKQGEVYLVPEQDFLKKVVTK